MVVMKKMTFRNEEGFALIAAIIACMLLLAIGMLVIRMSTGDMSSSIVTVGDKKALSATESGIHTVIQTFNPDSTTWTTTNNYTDCSASTPFYIWRTISSGASTGVDARTRFAVCRPTGSILAPLPVIGAAGSALDEWMLARYNTTVIGENTGFNTLNRVTIGIGYGPVPTK